MTPRSITIAVWEFWARAFIWKRTTPSALSGCAFRASVVDVPYAEGNKNYGATSAPLIVKDKVLVGTSGGDDGVRGFVAAYDAETGKLAWRFWTIPGPGEFGNSSWPGELYKRGGGTTGCQAPTTRNSIQFFGVPVIRAGFRWRPASGDDLYTDCVLALDPIRESSNGISIYTARPI